MVVNKVGPELNAAECLWVVHANMHTAQALVYNAVHQQGVLLGTSLTVMPRTRLAQRVSLHSLAMFEQHVLFLSTLCVCICSQQCIDYSRSAHNQSQTHEHEPTWGGQAVSYPGPSTSLGLSVINDARHRLAQNCLALPCLTSQWAGCVSLAFRRLEWWYTQDPAMAQAP